MTMFATTVVNSVCLQPQSAATNLEASPLQHIVLKVLLQFATRSFVNRQIFLRKRLYKSYFFFLSRGKH